MAQFDRVLEHTDQVLKKTDKIAKSAVSVVHKVESNQTGSDQTN